MNVERRRLSDHPLIYVPLGLLAFGIVAVLSALYPVHPRNPKSDT